jgi:hypothetical protein
MTGTSPRSALALSPLHPDLREKGCEEPELAERQTRVAMHEPRHHARTSADRATGGAQRDLSTFVTGAEQLASAPLRGFGRAARLKKTSEYSDRGGGERRAARSEAKQLSTSNPELLRDLSTELPCVARRKELAKTFLILTQVDCWPL